MSAVRKKLLPSPSVYDALLPLVLMGAEEFARFQEQVSTFEGFNSDKKRCESIAKDIGVSVEEAGILLTVLDGLYQRIRDIKDDDGADRHTLSTMLRGFVDEIADEQPDSRLPLDWKSLLNARLVEILIDKGSYIEKSRKIARLRVGFIKNATRVGTFVDLRPDFSEDGGQIDKWVPIIQFRITTDADSTSARDFVFQCDQLGLKKFREAIERAEKKLSTLFEVSNQLKIDIINQHRGD